MNSETELKKIDYSISHAQDRAYKRYGVKLSQYDIFSIVALIQGGESDKVVFMRRQSNYRTVWNIKYNDLDLFVVYNNRYKVIATFLTKEMAENPKSHYRRDK